MLMNLISYEKIVEDFFSYKKLLMNLNYYENIRTIVINFVC